MRVNDNDSTPPPLLQATAHRVDMGCCGTTQWEEPPRHGKEGHNRVPPAVPYVAVYFIFFSFIVIFVVVQRGI